MPGDVPHSSEAQFYLYKSLEPAWVVARDEDDALEVWCEHIGEAPGDYAADEWERQPDEATASYWLTPDGAITSPDNDDDGEPVELRADEVVRRFGRGFIASVNF